MVLIRVEGSINALYSPHLRSVILEGFAHDIRGVVIDLAQVNYIDSSGLATLVEGIQLASAREKKFLLAGANDNRIRHMMEITRLNELFELHEDVEAARKTIME